MCLTSLGLVASYGASEPFFKDKTVRVIVFATPGGGYDYYARLLGRYMTKHLAGSPKVIVQNMPIGQLAANNLWRAKPDGLTWATLSREGYLGNIAGDKSLKYDFSKGIPIGSVADENSVIYVRSDTGVKTVKDLIALNKAGKKLPIMGGTTRTASSYSLGRTLQAIVPDAKFKQVLGYPGGSEVDLALRKGEIQAAGRSKASFFSRVGDMYKSGEIGTIIQTGTVRKERDPDFADNPTFWELAKNEKQTQLLSLMLLGQLVARPFWLPPNMKADRVKEIRSAFDKAVRDPGFVAEAKKARRHVQPLSGVEVEELYKTAYGAPPEAKAFVKQVYGGR